MVNTNKGGARKWVWQDLLAISIIWIVSAMIGAFLGTLIFGPRVVTVVEGVQVIRGAKYSVGDTVHYFDIFDEYESGVVDAIHFEKNRILYWVDERSYMFYYEEDELFLTDDEKTARYQFYERKINKLKEEYESLRFQWGK